MAQIGPLWGVRYAYITHNLSGKVPPRLFWHCGFCLLSSFRQIYWGEFDSLHFDNSVTILQTFEKKVSTVKNKWVVKDNFKRWWQVKVLFWYLLPSLFICFAPSCGHSSLMTCWTRRLKKSSIFQAFSSGEQGFWAFLMRFFSWWSCLNLTIVDVSCFKEGCKEKTVKFFSLHPYLGLAID